MTIFEKVNKLEGGTLNFSEFIQNYCPGDFVNLEGCYKYEFCREFDDMEIEPSSNCCSACWQQKYIENSNNYTAEEIIKTAAMIRSFCDKQERCNTCLFARLRCGVTECILNSSIPLAWELNRDD